MRIAFDSARRWGIPLAIAAVLIAVVVFWPRSQREAGKGGGIWTCSMHPQIRMDHFDRCPICGMDLVPVANGDGEQQLPPDQLKLSEHAQQMARVATTAVARRLLLHEIRTVGRIDFDETRMKQIASRVDGRVDQVFADFPGTKVKEADHLVSIYSPNLVSTQEEFLLASRRQQEQRAILPNAPDLAASARRRLKLWGLTDQQLDDILASGRAETHLVIYAPIGGTIVEKMVRAGQYVKEGDTLYTIADLGHVWLIVEVYETDLAWVRFGQTVQVTLEADPSASFTGQVGFIEPVLNEQTRTVRVRVILKNDEGKLKPGMFALALIQVAVMPDGSPGPTGLEGKFACPMHPYVVQDHEGECRVCLMALEQIPGTPMPSGEPPQVLSIPAEAVLTTGRRRLVYVARESGVYQLVEPQLGSRAGDFFPVLGGLKEGDRVVSRGNFLLDSQFQISGKPSLFYPEGMTGGGGHAHGAASPGAPAAQDPKRAETISANLAKLSAADRKLVLAQKDCPITGEPLGSMGVPPKLDVNGQRVFVCCAGCTPEVRKEPEKALAKIKGRKSEVGGQKSEPTD
ncbi:MAG TPA: efflux RND transporter periplasmic adaptor subunit [Pirellulaceae bacterium]|nr:efflux RND transporter periplasmic adaptor subunit [Pirellulaceae bacterium]